LGFASPAWAVVATIKAVKTVVRNRLRMEAPSRNEKQGANFALQGQRDKGKAVGVYNCDFNMLQNDAQD
jgi:hypothetical protein